MVSREEAELYELLVVDPYCARPAHGKFRPAESSRSSRLADQKQVVLSAIRTQYLHLESVGLDQRDF